MVSDVGGNRRRAATAARPSTRDRLCPAGTTASSLIGRSFPYQKPKNLRTCRVDTRRRFESHSGACTTICRATSFRPVDSTALYMDSTAHRRNCFAPNQRLAVIIPWTLPALFYEDSNYLFQMAPAVESTATACRKCAMKSTGGMQKGRRTWAHCTDWFWTSAGKRP